MASNRLDAKDFIGRIYKTNRSGDCFIVDLKDSYDITVMFYDGYYVNVNKGNLDKGKVRNPHHPSNKSYGVGLFDSTSVGKDPDVMKIINSWNNMLQRCYSARFHKRQPSYKEVVVCERWKTYSNFESDIMSMYNYEKFLKYGWVLDKDALKGDVSIYSPETCCFIPKRLNSMLASLDGLFDSSVGASKVPSGKYRTSASTNCNSKCFDTKEEALFEYRKIRCSLFVSELEKWKDIVDDVVIDSVLRKVEECRRQMSLTSVV